MADYRLFYATTERPTDILGMLKWSTLSYTDMLNSPGSINITIPLDQAGGATPAVMTAENFSPGKTWIFVDRDGTLIFAGLLWSATANLTTSSMSLVGQGPGSYLRRRLITTTQTFEGIDQATIVSTLLTAATTGTGANPGITWSIPTTGVTRDRVYNGYEYQGYMSVIEQLAAVRGGFDFRWFTEWDSSGDPVIRFDLLYPATPKETNHRFEVGVNASLTAYTVDANGYANTIYVTGSGDGLLQISTSQTDAALLGAYPLLERIESYPDTTHPAVLTSQSLRLLDRYKVPLKRATLTTTPDTLPNLGSYDVGDKCRLVASQGWVSVDEDHRIVSRTVTVDNTGKESVVCSLVDVGVFT